MKLISFQISFNDAFKQLQPCFDVGGFIAGGFVRKMLLSDNSLSWIDDYAKNKGDIDLFFPDDRSLFETSSALHGHQSIGPIEASVKINGCRIKAQLISVTKGNPTDILSDFGVKNIRCAFDGDSVIFDEELIVLEQKKELGIAHIENRWLGTHVRKMLTVRGLERVEEASMPLLATWLENLRPILPLQVMDASWCLEHEQALSNVFVEQVKKKNPVWLRQCEALKKLPTASTSR